MDNQVDYAVVRNQAIQKVYKQELIDKQNAENSEKTNILLLNVENQKSNNLMDRTETSLTKKSSKSVMFNLCELETI